MRPCPDVLQRGRVEADKEKAVELFKKAVNNGNGEALYEPALVYFDQDAYSKAKEYLQLYVKQQPEDVWRLGEAYFRLSQFYLEYDKKKGKTRISNGRRNISTWP